MLAKLDCKLDELAEFHCKLDELAWLIWRYFTPKKGEIAYLAELDELSKLS